MAFVPEVLGTPAAETTNGTSIAIASIAPAANALVFTAVSVRAGINASLSGLTISDDSSDVGAWEVFSHPHPTTAANSTWIIGGFALAGASPGTFTVTVSFTITGGGNTATRRDMMVGQIPDGFDSADLVEQFKVGDSSTSTMAITLDTPPAATSCVMGITSSLNAAGITPGTDFTELVDIETSPTDPDLGLHVQYDVGPVDGVVDWSSLGTLSAGIAFEIPVAAVVADRYLQIDTQPVTTQEDTVMAAIEVSIRLDADDSIDTDYTGDVSVAITPGENPGSGTLSGTTTVACVAGEAVFDDLEIDNPGAGYTLTFTCDDADPTTLESASFDITAAAADHLFFFVQPENVNVGEIMFPSIVVQARNPDNEVDTTFNGDVTIAINDNPSGATLSGTTTVTAVNGVATFDDLSIDLPGDGYTLIASEA